MAEIMRIVIKGSSGYCCYDEAYTDKVTITSDSIAYEYKPECESEINPKRKWSYKTTSPAFHLLFGKLREMTPSILNKSDIAFCTDVGIIEFTVTFSNKAKQTKGYYCTGDEFKVYFGLIKEMVPGCEYVPAVLLTEGDYT